MTTHPRFPSGSFALLWFLLAASAPLFASCSYVSTAPFQGVVRDSATGEPIAGVLVECTWRGRKIGMVPVDSAGKLFRIEQTVTDREGRYEIPAVWFVHVKTLQVFSSGGCGFSHPIYKGTGFGYQWKVRIIRETPLYEQFYQEHAQDGAIRYDIELVPVHMVYTSTEHLNDFEWYMHSQDPRLWLYMKRKYNVRYDIQSILDTWSSIAATVGSSSDIPTLNEKKKKIDELLKGGY